MCTILLGFTYIYQVRVQLLSHPAAPPLDLLFCWRLELSAKQNRQHMPSRKPTRYLPTNRRDTIKQVDAIPAKHAEGVPPKYAHAIPPNKRTKVPPKKSSGIRRYTTNRNKKPNQTGGEFGWVGFLVVCFLYNISPNPRKIICWGKKVAQMPLLTQFLLDWVGLGLGSSSVSQ